VNPLFIGVLALVGWEIAVRRGIFGGLRLKLPAFGPAAVVAAAAVLVGAFAAQLALCDYQSAHDGIRPVWFAAAPLHFVDDAYPFGPAHAAFSFGALALAIVQTLALFVIAGGVANPASSGAARIVPFVAAFALGALAFASPVVTSGDVFGYVGIGMLGAHPFARPEDFFHGQYAQVFANYPIRPTVYGPVWVVVNAGAVALATTFAGKIFALRLLGAILLGLLVVLARALGAGRAALCALALNPMLWFQFVANAHNDMFAIALVVAALVAVGRRLLSLAVIFVAAAGAVKVPFLVLGIVIFARHRDRRMGIVAAAASVALAVGVSAAYGGHAYLDGLLATGRGRVVWGPEVAVAKAAVALLALGATVAALVFRRFVGFAAWFYPGLAPLLFPWYLAWTIPYACAAGSGLLETLLVLPIAATMADTIYGLDLFGLAVAVAVVTFVVVDLRRRHFAPLTA